MMTLHIDFTYNNSYYNTNKYDTTYAFCLLLQLKLFKC